MIHKKFFISLMVVVIFILVLFFLKKDPAQIQQEQNSQRNTNTAEADLKDALVAEDGNYVFQTPATVNWEGKKELIVGYKDNGTLAISSGNAKIENGKVVSGKIVFDMKSIAATSTGKNSGQDLLSQHLKSEDFFDAEVFPTAEFVITDSVPPQGTDPFQHILMGDLTIKGITNKVSFSSKIYAKDGTAYIDAGFGLDRTMWNIRYGSDKFFDNLADNVIDDFFMVNFVLQAKKVE